MEFLALGFVMIVVLAIIGWVIAALEWLGIINLSDKDEPPKGVIIIRKIYRK